MVRGWEVVRRKTSREVVAGNEKREKQKETRRRHRYIQVKDPN
jgi:hypothetical protein